MTGRQALIGIALAAVLGLAAGLLVQSPVGGMPLVAALSRVTGQEVPSSRVQRLEQELQQLEQRSAQLEEMRAEIELLRARVAAFNEQDAFREAEELGVVRAILAARPRLREATVRRMSIALVEEARRHDFDPLLLTALARVESTFNPYAVSSAGARGVLQIMPPTGRALLRAQGSTMLADEELHDIETNVSLGTRYLAELVREFGTLDLALLAYNRGPTAARTVLAGPNAQRALNGYPRAVLAEHRRLAELAGREPLQARL